MDGVAAAESVLAAAARRERVARRRREAERASTGWPAFGPQVGPASGYRCLDVHVPAGTWHRPEQPFCQWDVLPSVHESCISA